MPSEHGRAVEARTTEPGPPPYRLGVAASYRPLLARLRPLRTGLTACRRLRGSAGRAASYRCGQRRRRAAGASGGSGSSRRTPTSSIVPSGEIGGGWWPAAAQRPAALRSPAQPPTNLGDTRHPRCGWRPSQFATNVSSPQCSAARLGRPLAISAPARSTLLRQQPSWRLVGHSRLRLRPARPARRGASAVPTAPGTGAKLRLPAPADNNGSKANSSNYSRNNRGPVLSAMQKVFGLTRCRGASALRPTTGAS